MMIPTVDGSAESGASVMISRPEVVRRGAIDDDILIAGRRVGRVMFGSALVLGALVLVAAAATYSKYQAVTAAPTPLIFATTWLGALVAYVVGRIGGAAFVKVRGLPLQDSLLFPSLALPLVGMSLVAPLTLHAIISLFLDDATGFEEWTRMALLVVGHVHVALALMCARAAWRMSRGEQHISGVKILFITVGIACVPGVVLLALPPVIVLATGVVFVPAMIAIMSRISDDEIWKTRVDG
ncbi:MAG: hypothetical protein Q8O67_00705 [Deltaproteobacteria bacterium]|nr:hypothetical protein [Deltaproteobacteria bacterium]